MALCWQSIHVQPFSCNFPSSAFNLLRSAKLTIDRNPCACFKWMHWHLPGEHLEVKRSRNLNVLRTSKAVLRCSEPLSHTAIGSYWLCSLPRVSLKLLSSRWDLDVKKTCEPVNRCTLGEVEGSWKVRDLMFFPCFPMVFLDVQWCSSLGWEINAHRVCHFHSQATFVAVSKRCVFRTEVFPQLCWLPNVPSAAGLNWFHRRQCVIPGSDYELWIWIG